MLGARPVVAISDSSVPSGHELNGVSSGLVLPDRSVLIANAGLSELALFDSRGRFVRAVGRKGQGPGELLGGVSVFSWRADSLIAFDPAAQRWTIIDPQLALARASSAPDSTVVQPTWLYQGTVVADGVLGVAPAWTLEVLERVRRARDPNFTQLFQARHDDLGALWIRTDAQRNDWEAYTSAEAPAGRARGYRSDLRRVRGVACSGWLG